jgi:hypothetical protein
MSDLRGLGERMNEVFEAGGLHDEKEATMPGCDTFPA